MDMNICVVGTLNQLVITSIVKIKFPKKKEVSGKTLFFMIGLFVLTLAFDKAVLYGMLHFQS